MISIVLATSLFQSETKPLPFEREILTFQKRDAENPPAKGQILLIGSSSFTNWQDVNAYFPGKSILNRAFGGSTLIDLTTHANFLLDSYSPRQIIIYCGENDLASSEKPAAYTVFNRFQTFLKILRIKHPTMPVAYVGMKPSWSRWHLRAKYKICNKWISDLTLKDRNFQYINVWDAMLDANGTPRKDIFIKDELHMNAKGYEIWKPIFERYLK
jgi:lysophospholipase L1-like esterase